MRKNEVEVWKSINGYNGLYEISSIGRVKSVERFVEVTSKLGKKYARHLKEKILDATKDRWGYLYVSLSKNGLEEKRKIHQLVAEAFIPNPYGYDDIHHINHDKTNNRIENLMWMNGNEHNAMHMKESLSKRIDQIDCITGEVLHQWESAMDAKRALGYSQGHISDCARGEIKSYKNYVWKYVI